MRPGTVLASQPDRGNWHPSLSHVQNQGEATLFDGVHSEPPINALRGCSEGSTSTAKKDKCHQRGCVQPGQHSGSHIFDLRPSRDEECSIRRIGASMPDDAVELAKHPRRWLDEVRAALLAYAKRADFCDTVVRVAKGLISGVRSWRRAITRPTWATLTSISGRDRRSMARALRWLRDRGLVSIVATGRSVQYSKAQEADAAVYALWMTYRTELPSSTNEINVTPTPLGAISKPTRTSVERCSPTVSLREAHSWGKSPASRLSFLRRVAYAGASPVDPASAAIKAAGSGTADAGRIQAGRPLRKAARLKKERMARAAILQRSIPVLRLASTRSIASVIRPFIMAGWTDDDIVHAINWKLSGTRWPHSANWLIGRPDLWLKYRLKDWMDENGPVESRSQTQARVAEANRKAWELRRTIQATEQAQIEQERVARAATWGEGVTGLEAAELRAQGYVAMTEAAAEYLEQYRELRRRRALVNNFFSPRNQ